MPHVNDTKLRLIPFGDKLALVEKEREAGIEVIGKEIHATVLAVGPGLPYGRGEYYAPSAKPGMTVIVPMKAWEDAQRIRWDNKVVRFVHERDVLSGVVGGSEP